MPARTCSRAMDGLDDLVTATWSVNLAKSDRSLDELEGRYLPRSARPDPRLDQ